MFNKNKKTQIINIVLLYLLSIIGWLSLVVYREITQKNIEILNKKIIGDCDFWCIGHFIHYILLTYFAHNFWWILIIIGYIFEIFELYLNNLTKYIKGKIIKDTITNSLGVLVGYILYQIFPNKISLYKILLKR